MTKPSWIAALLALTLTLSNGEEGWRGVISSHCLDCHDSDSTKGDLNLEDLLDANVDQNTDSWEKVVRQIEARQMPPLDKKRPTENEYADLAENLTTRLDAAFEKNPNPRRTDTIRRLTRTEYKNAIRDLLALEIDTEELLPPDESSHGFDNVTVGDLSPALLSRYLTAAQKISRLAVGIPGDQPTGRTVRIQPDITQEEHVPGLPLGTRGGALIQHHFPQSGDYEIRVRLSRDRNEMIEGLKRKHQLELLLDKKSVGSFEIEPPPNPADHTKVDAKLVARFKVAAGPHKVGITFQKLPSSISESLRQPYGAHFNFHRHPRLSPAVYQVSIIGPFGEGNIASTPSRDILFGKTTVKDIPPEERARKILGEILRNASRRPVSEGKVERLLEFFHEGKTFDEGIENALAAILVSRDFLFRVENPPAEAEPTSPYRISEIDLASRLSFFLWSSIPDEELLSVAESGILHRPEVLESQARRMLADPRSRSLVSNFADQWLYLRNLDSITPDSRLFPDFDDNLRQAFRTETEMLFENILRENRSVLDLLSSRETYLNERLAKHYGIPNVYGTRFRPVSLSDKSHRGGILRHGSILTVTSYATRTSPVIRGHWVLKNLLGTPPPPPPPDTPALDDNTVSASLPFRERLALHSENAACASCHKVMDPIGFSLENFDAVGRWRIFENGKKVDARGGFSDGSEFEGVEKLEEALLRRPEIFARTVTEKLLVYALGRGVETSDAPAIRKVVKSSAADDYRLSDLIVELTKSIPFTMRMSDSPN